MRAETRTERLHTQPYVGPSHKPQSRDVGARLRIDVRKYVARCVATGLKPEAFAFSTLHHPRYSLTPGRVIQRVIDEEITELGGGIKSESLRR